MRLLRMRLLMALLLAISLPPPLLLAFKLRMHAGDS
jgi:hypothetical protein